MELQKDPLSQACPRGGGQTKQLQTNKTPGVEKRQEGQTSDCFNCIISSLSNTTACTQEIESTTTWADLQKQETCMRTKPVHMPKPMCCFCTLLTTACSL